MPDRPAGCTLISRPSGASLIRRSQVFRRTNWRHRTCFQSRFNLPNITVDIRPAGPCRLGIALPGRFTVTFRFSTAAFRRVLAVRRPPNRSLTSSDCFAASAAAFFWRPQRLWLPQLSQRRPLSSASAAAFFSASAAAFLSFSGRFLLRGLCGFCSAAAAAAFFASSACFWRRQRRPLLLASASAFFCASACALATFSASAFALAAAASATFCCSLALAAAASAAFAARRPVSAAPLPSAVAQPAPWRPAQLSPAPPNALLQLFQALLLLRLLLLKLFGLLLRLFWRCFSARCASLLCCWRLYCSTTAPDQPSLRPPRCHHRHRRRPCRPFPAAIPKSAGQSI